MYVSSVDINDPTIIRVYEVWESAEALKPHFKTPHIGAFQKALSELRIKSTNTKAYEANKEIPFESLRLLRAFTPILGFKMDADRCKNYYTFFGLENKR